MGQERQVIADVTGDEEILPDVLAPGLAHAPQELGVAREISDPDRAALHGVPVYPVTP